MADFSQAVAARARGRLPAGIEPESLQNSAAQRSRSLPSHGTAMQDAPETPKPGRKQPAATTAPSSVASGSRVNTPAPFADAGVLFSTPTRVASAGIPDWSPPPSWLGVDKLSNKNGGILKCTSTSASLAGNTNFFSVPLRSIVATTGRAVVDFIQSGGRYLLERHVRPRSDDGNNEHPTEPPNEDPAAQPRQRLRTAYDTLCRYRDQQQQYQRRSRLAKDRLDASLATQERLQAEARENHVQRAQRQRLELRQKRYRQQRAEEWERRQASIKETFLEQWNEKQKQKAAERKRKRDEEDRAEEAAKKARQAEQASKKLKSDAIKEDISARQAKIENLQETRSELVWLLKQVIKAETKQKMEMAMKAKKAKATGKK